MILYGRPYIKRALKEGSFLGPQDSFLCEFAGTHPPEVQYARLMSWMDNVSKNTLGVLPYPKRGRSDAPPVSGLPHKPKIGSETRNKEDRIAHDTYARMNQVVARIQELENALDDPMHVWSRLREAWNQAENEANPRMAEIVRQSRDVLSFLCDVERRLRRVLRREKERIPLDRVQEIDRSSMLWFARQPGRTTVERAGADQRVLAISRRENFDTPENRVVRAYVILASKVSREWLLEHTRAETSDRYKMVKKFMEICRRMDRDLEDLEIGIAEPDIIPNYVLLYDKAYRRIYEAWRLLLNRDLIEDDIWAWQAESWTDFCALALTLSLDSLNESVLVAQSPILWESEISMGRCFSQKNPLAVFWLPRTGLVVEVQARPTSVSTHQARTRAVIWLKLQNHSGNSESRRIAVWTPHSMSRGNPKEEAALASEYLLLTQKLHIKKENIREGLILMPGHGRFESEPAQAGQCRVNAIALDAVGKSLASGIECLGNYIRETLGTGSS